METVVTYSQAKVGWEMEGAFKAEEETTLDILRKQLRKATARQVVKRDLDPTANEIV